MISHAGPAQADSLFYIVRYKGFSCSQRGADQHGFADWEPSVFMNADGAKRQLLFEHFHAAHDYDHNEKHRLKDFLQLLFVDPF